MNNFLLILLIITGFHQAGKTSSDYKVNPPIEFISETPIIDGRLDANLQHLAVQEFNQIWQFDNPVTDTAYVSYRMAYTPNHLYIYIETDVDSITYHRRGYLWGDGYMVLLGIPQKDGLTDAYCEIKISPTLEKEYGWARQTINSTIISASKKLSTQTKSQELAQRNISGFELLIAWEDIRPFHPWFMNEMGYNIYFAKGIELEEHDWITNGYSLVEDEGIWDEEIPKRNYELTAFENPTSIKDRVILANPKKSNLQIGEPLKIELATIDYKVGKDKFHVRFIDHNSELIAAKEIEALLDTKLKKDEITLNLDTLNPGRYHLIVHNSKDTIINEPLAILPSIDFQDITKALYQNKNQLERGTTNTLQFEINQISTRLKNLKGYEIGLDLLDDWQLFQKKYELFNRGIDPFKDNLDPYRRAFKSKHDETYQPYTIKLPENYNPHKKYPLLVFMHGSGRDEQGLLNRPRSGGNFIEIAPLARDIYRAYAEDYSQKDIIEAIEDVSKYFAVDTSNIIIGGFSMGGYGSLRSFYEHPALYKGVVVHAGHPNLANEWLDGEHPNFLDEKYLSSFYKVPVFIYHGRKDAACEVKLIEQMSEKLIKAGALVTIRIVEENGHEYPDDKTNKLYFEWLNNILSR